MASVRFANDYDFIQRQIENFGPIAGALPMPFERERSRTKNYHENNFEEKLLKQGYTFEHGRWKKGTI